MEWFDLKEKTPSDSKDLLFYNPLSGYLAGYALHDEQGKLKMIVPAGQSPEGGIRCFTRWTHWAEIPKAPGDERS